MSGGDYTGDFDGNSDTDASGDGGPYTIKNLYINRTAGSYAGLFAYLNAAADTQKFENVALENVDVTLTLSSSSSSVFVGPLAAKSETDIEDSYTTGEVNATVEITSALSSVSVGGIVGWQQDGDIVSSYSWASVTGDISASTQSAYLDAGGLVGRLGETKLSNSPTAQVLASYAAGDVTGKRDSTGEHLRVGGLVGLVESGSKIEASYARGDVNGDTTSEANNARGGLVGYLGNGGSVGTSFSTGKLLGTASSGKCGLVGGQPTTGATVTNSYYDSDTLGQTGCNSKNGTAKTTSELQTPTAYGTGASIYKDWNIDLDSVTAGTQDGWDFGTADQYPALKYGGLTAADQRPTVTLTASPTTIYEAVGGATSSTLTATLSAKWNNDVTVTLPAASEQLTVTGSPISFTSGNTGDWGTAQTATVKLASAPTKTIVVDFTRLSANDPEVKPKYLTFTTSDWNTAQNISVKFLAEPTAATTRVEIVKNSSNVTTGYKVNVDAYRRAYDLGSPTITIDAGATTNTATLTAQNDYNDLANATVTPTLATHPADTKWISKGTGTAPSMTITDDDELGQVTGVTAVQKTDAAGNLAGGATVSWTKVTGATGYVIEWKSGTEIYDSSRRLVAGDVATYDIPASSLTPGTTYYIRVYATKSGADHGLPSGEVTLAYTGWLVFAPVAASLSITEPASGTATGTYTVKLGSQPSATVTVALTRGADSSSDDPTFSPSSLTFTGGNSGNWNTAQTVTVTVATDADGVDDVVNILHTASSTGADFSGVTATVTATEADNNDPPTSADFTRYVKPKSESSNTSVRVGVYFPYTDTDALEAVHIVTLPDAAQGTLKFLQRRVGPRRNVTTNVNAGDRALSYTGTPGIRAKVLYFYPSDSFSSATFTFRVEDKAGNISDDTYTATLRLEGTTPAKPSNFAATAGNTRVTLSWDNPNNSTITKYQYQQRLTEGTLGRLDGHLRKKRRRHLLPGQDLPRHHRLDQRHKLRIPHSRRERRRHQPRVAHRERHARHPARALGPHRHRRRVTDRPGLARLPQRLHHRLPGAPAGGRRLPRYLDGHHRPHIHAVVAYVHHSELRHGADGDCPARRRAVVRRENSALPGQRRVHAVNPYLHHDGLEHAAERQRQAQGRACRRYDGEPGNGVVAQNSVLSRRDQRPRIGQGLQLSDSRAGRR